MTDITALTALVAPEAEALGLDLVRVAWFGGAGARTVQVVAERPDTRQLTIDDCAALSRRISDRLDALEADGADPIDEAYRLEVSSPGIDRPLTRLKDYADWAGHEAKVTFVAPVGGRKSAKGVINGCEGETISIGEPPLSMMFANIADAKLVITDRLIAATRPLSAEGADDIQLEGQD